MARSPIHMNENQLAAIAMRTTGGDPDRHEILQLAVIPLTPDYTPHPTIPMFDVVLKPYRWQNKSCAVSMADIQNALMLGVDQQFAADLFIEWFERLKLNRLKSLIPVGFGYLYKEKEFMIRWMGRLNYNYVCSPYVRDIMHSVLFLDDSADVNSQYIPFPKMGLYSMARRTGVDYYPTRDPIRRALGIAAIYKEILKLPVLTS